MTDVDIAEMFASLGPVTIKRIFGAKGIYHQGLIIALEVDGEVLLKVDDKSKDIFAEAGAKQWSYQGKTKPVTMPYSSIPNAAYDGPDEMADRVRMAYEAAVRAQ